MRTTFFLPRALLFSVERELEALMMAIWPACWPLRAPLLSVKVSVPPHFLSATSFCHAIQSRPALLSQLTLPSGRRYVPSAATTAAVQVSGAKLSPYSPSKPVIFLPWTGVAASLQAVSRICLEEVGWTGLP